MRYLTLSLALGVLLACDSTGPAEFTGTYELEMSNGQRLPVAYFPGSATQIESGELTVTDDSHFNVTLAISGGMQGHTFSYSRDGDSLIVPGPMGSGGRVSGRTVTLRLSFPLPPSQGFGLTWHDMVFVR